MRIKSLLVVATLAVSLPFSYAESKIELLPEVKQILNAELDESTLNQNGYVALLAINAPEGMDSKELGKKMVLANAEKMREAIQREDIGMAKKAADIDTYYGGKASLKLKLPDDYRPIYIDLHDHNILDKVIKERVQLEQIVKDNQTLYTRYVELINLPYYNQPSVITIDNNNFSTLMQLLDTRLQLAILQINEGKVDAGLAILQQEIVFSKRIMVSKPTSSNQILAFRRLFAIYHTINCLLDTPQFANQLANPKLLALLKPLTEQEQQAAARELTSIRNLQLVILAVVSEEYFIQNLDSFLPNFKEDIPLTYNKEATLNANYRKFAEIIDIAKIPLPKAAEYVTVLKNAIKNEPKIRAEIYNSYDKNNVLGEMLLDLDHSSHNKYTLWGYNLVNYLTLVNAKLAIKQAGINKAEVPAFLIQLGDKAKNPYTQEPFDWDADKQLLFSNWLDAGSKYSLDGERASVNIQFK